jgi:hypothetical protein
MRESLRKMLLASACLAFTALPAATAWAAGDYVRICSLYGANFFYIPGTDVCYNSVNGETRQATEYGVRRIYNRVDLAFEGMNVAAAMPTPVIDPGKGLAVAVSGGFFDSSGAAAIAGAVEFNDNLSLSGGISLGARQHSVGSNVGFNFTW